MATNNCTILYVEDDADFAGLNIQWFTERGYNVIYAPNGTEAIEAFGKTAPDIVLLDVMLPDMLGYDVCKQMQQIDENVPVIFLTSLSDTQNAIRGLESGAYDYIRKDADLQEIETRLKAILIRTGHNNIIHITENSYIDNRRMTVVVLDKECKVGYRVIKLLQLLLQQKNHICQRDFLTAKVWSDHSLNADIYLNQSIGTLRRIFSADKQVKLKTFRNAGILLEIKR